MSAIRIIRQSIVLGIAVGFVVAMAGLADAQIFRRPGRAAQSSPNSPPPRGAFPARPFRGGQNPDVTIPGSSFPGGAIPREAQAAEQERLVLVPLDEKPFEVEQADIVRLTAQGIAGSEFTTKIEGPARLHRKVYVAGISEGQLSVGGEEAEYEFAMTGLGKVKIDVVVTYPNGPEPKVTTYRFEVAASKN